MKLFADQEIKKLFFTLTAAWAAALLAAALILQPEYRCFSRWLLPILLSAAGCSLLAFLRYFHKQEQLLEQAVSQIRSFLDGDAASRIECDREGTLYRLFHSVNSLAAVLNAHADNELREKLFLKNTLSDISHQLKTPLAALSIYNSLLQEEASEEASVKEFALLSEKELDRMEMLIQSLLKITRLDAGSVVFEKSWESVADMMQDVELHFTYRAKQEQKEILLSGPEQTLLFCDRDWLTEAMDNIVKNALDHTGSGGRIFIEWKPLSSGIRISVRDNGRGIHPEDLHHIFKRFYRSRFSKDTQGIGLGLPLAKAVIEAHDGSIEADSEPGKGTRFTMFFMIPTKL